MQLETLTYHPDSGWSSELPRALDSQRTLVLAFGSADPAEAGPPLEQLEAAFPQSRLLGCSTAGEIHDATLGDHGLVAAVVRFEHTELRSVAAVVAGRGGSFEAGAEVARQLAGSGLRAVLVLSEGIEVNGSELVRGLNAELPADVVVTGGLAGDGDRFNWIWTYGDRLLQRGVVSAVGLYGDRVSVGHGSFGGWDPFGLDRLVTRSDGNVLYELDGKPALALYKEYLGRRAADLPSAALLFPLALNPALNPESGEQERVVRTVLSIDEDLQSMTFAGDIPQGRLATFMHANFDRLIQASATAATQVGQMPMDGRPLLSIAISCVGRRLVLSERAEEELEAALDVLPSGTRQVGFYSHGELSPFASGRCELHNQTMTLTTLSEC